MAEGVVATRRALVLMAWMAVGFLGCFALTLALPHDPYLRFQQLDSTIHRGVQWSYERIRFDPTPIDIAVIGNSRLGSGVDAPALQAALSTRVGRPVRVVNLSTPQEGRNMHYVMAREALEARPELSLIVLSMIEQMPRESHPAFRDLGRVSDVLGAPLLINRDWFSDAAYLPYRQIKLLAQSVAPEAFGRRSGFDPARYAGPDVDTTRSETLPDGRFIDREAVPPEPALRNAASARLAGIRPPLLPGWATDYEFAVERSFVRAIAAAAAARGVGLAFLHLPIYTDTRPPADLEFYGDLGFVLVADLVATRADLFTDYGHLNRTGAGVLVPWLADALAARIASREIALKQP